MEGRREGEGEEIMSWCDFCQHDHTMRGDSLSGEWDHADICECRRTDGEASYLERYEDALVMWAHR